MLPAACLTLGLLNLYEYHGIPLNKLAEIYRSGDPYPLQQKQLDEYGAYSPMSLPLYMKLLTTEPEAQESLPPATWTTLRVGACAIIPRVPGDKCMFVPVGITMLSNPNPSLRTWARIMLLDIATADDVPKVKAVIDLDDPKKVDTTVQATKVLSVIGGKDEIKYLETVLESKHVKESRFATEHVAGAIGILKRRLDEKAHPPDKK